MTAAGEFAAQPASTIIRHPIPNGVRVRLVFLALTAACGLATGFTAALTAPLAIELGASEFAAGVSVASLTMVVLIGDIFGTRALPYLEPRRCIVIGMALWAVGSIATTFAPTFATMEGARLLQGVGLCLYAAAGPEIALRLSQDGGFGKSLGDFQAAQIVGAMVAPVLGGGVVAIWPGILGLRIAFLICAVIAVACAAGALLLPAMPSGVRPRISAPHLPGLTRPRSLVALGTAAIGQGMRGAVVLTVVPLLAATMMGMATFAVGLFIFATFLIEAVVARIAGSSSDRIGRRPIVIGGAIAGGLGALGLLIAYLSAQQWVFLATTVPFGIAGGIFMGVLPTTVVDLADRPEVGVAGMRLSRDIGFSLMPVVLGALLAGPGTAFGIAACMVVFAVVAISALGVGETHRRRGTSAGTQRSQ
ncbi:MFS transporter [Cumulibacter soli]|uniref:MFS transporter n=1 Tax=Cumulibacter soli TaxID=2546344 RepID=UPI0010687B31|nr:MFS transporter [Cumulibacter soli]